MDPLARQFDRYRRIADLDALAAVFDATAPKMLRIAMHLAGDPHDAEDLLQQAFLVAIERAESFDARQPLTPWLLGIVRQLARGARRRRVAVAAEASVEPAVEGGAPGQDAEASELRSLLQRHIERLAPDQCQVLLLQLQHGLEPAEIAQVLELAPSTVRMRLKRGREALRRLLPASVGTVAAWSAGGSALAAIRVRTLDVAGQALSPGAVLSGSGVSWGLLGFAMKYWLLGAAAVLALVLGGVWWRSGSADDAPRVARDDRTSVVSAASDGLPAADGSGPRSPVGRPVPSTHRPAPTAAPREQAVVVGRAVDEAGAPLRGIEVSLDASWRSARERGLFVLEHGHTEWQRPETVETGEDGAFEIRCGVPELRTFQCALWGAGRMRVERRLGSLTAGETEDLGDLVVAQGASWSGLVVDDTGAPQPGVTIDVVQYRADLGVGGHGAARADAQGRFDAGALVLPGDYELRVPSRELVEPKGHVTLSEGGNRLHVVLKSIPPDTRLRIRGRVVDGDGEPLRGVEVFPRRARAFDPGGGERPGVRTSGSGWFELIRPSLFAKEPETTVSAFVAGYELWVSPGPIRWGTDDLRIELVAGPPVDVRLTSADGGAPVERFAVTIEPRRWDRWLDGDRELQHLGDHPGGLLRIPRLTPGEHRIDVVTPLGRSVSGPQVLELEAGRPGQLAFVLRTEREQVVEVVDHDGAPVAGSVVELVRHQGGGVPEVGMTVLDADVALQNGDHVLSREGVWRTDADGLATVRFVPTPGVGLRLPGPGHVPDLMPSLPDDATGPLRIVVDRGGVLAGRVGPPEFLAWLREDTDDEQGEPVSVELRLHELDGGRGRSLPLDVVMAPGYPVARDGRFRIEGVPSGAWSVDLLWSVPWTDGRGRVRSGMGHKLPAADRFEMPSGGEVSLGLDFSSFVPAPVRVVTTVDGSPRELSLHLERMLDAHPDGSERSFRMSWNVDGSGIREDRLPAGSWRVRAYYASDDLPVPVGEREFQLVPSPDAESPRELRLEFSVGRAGLRVLDPDGAPVEELELLLRRAGATSFDGFGFTPVTRGDGRVDVVAWPGPVELWVRRLPFVDPHAHRAWLRAHPNPSPLSHLVRVGEFVLVRGEPELTEFRLPDAWTQLPR